jgi:hypothetical protein
VRASRPLALSAALALALALALGLGACARPVPEPALALPAVPPGLGFLLRQQLAFEYGERSGSIESLLRVRCGELTVIGFAPFGARAFTLRQRGRALDVQLHLPGSWPFAPQNIVRDIHRVFLVPLPTEPPPGGTRRLRYGGEDVRERWAGGRLRERALLERGRPERDAVVVQYRDGASRAQRSRDLRLENRRRGYALEVRTLESLELSCDDPP